MELLTITEAAAAVGVSDRTIRKYTRAGKIAAHVGPDGRPRYQRQAVEELRAAHQWVPQGSEGIGTPDRNEAEAVGSPGRNGSEAFRTDRNGAAGENVSHGTHQTPELLALRAQLVAAERERETMAEVIDHLRAQVDARTQAERELRAMMARLEVTNNELAATLVQRALPAATVEAQTPRRVKWWRLWERR